MKKLIFALLLIPTLAFAQESLTPDQLSKRIQILQLQRNNAMDQLVLSDQKVLELIEEVQKLQDQIVDLESDLEDDDGSD